MSHVFTRVMLELALRKAPEGRSSKRLNKLHVQFIGGALESAILKNPQAGLVTVQRVRSVCRAVAYALQGQNTMLTSIVNDSRKWKATMILVDADALHQPAFLRCMESIGLLSGNTVVARQDVQSGIKTKEEIKEFAEYIFGGMARFIGAEIERDSADAKALRDAKEKAEEKETAELEELADAVNAKQAQADKVEADKVEAARVFAENAENAILVRIAQAVENALLAQVSKASKVSKVRETA